MGFQQLNRHRFVEMKPSRKISLIAGIPLLAGVLCAAFAVTQNDNLTVSANVVATCAIQGSSLPFGNYESKSLEQSGNVSVNCSNGTTYTVALDNGAAGAGAARVMQGPANATLSYQLYKDVGRTEPWGSTAAGDLVSSVGNGAQQNLTVYGRIPAGQLPAAGTYGDVVGVTLAY
jgi:spore coat protein U-like protein